MVNGAVPEDVSVSDCVDDAFTVTFPKLRFVALAVSCGLVAAVPVPVNVITVVLPDEELLLIISWPLAEPVAAGLNCTWSVIDCVGFSVTGRLPPVTVKPAPEIVAELIVSGAFPEEVSVSV
jgi:hypothetical protein